MKRFLPILCIAAAWFVFQPTDAQAQVRAGRGVVYRSSGFYGIPYQTFNLSGINYGSQRYGGQQTVRSQQRYGVSSQRFAPSIGPRYGRFGRR